MTKTKLEPIKKLSFNHIKNMIKKSNIFEMIDDQSYNFMFTITFTECMRKNTTEQYNAINFLLHLINRELYKNPYKTGKLYNIGYAILEGDDYDNFKYTPNKHCHLLLKLPTPCDLDMFKDILNRVYPKVSAYPGSCKPAFNKVGFDTQDLYYQKGAIKYCIKDIRGDINNVLPIGKKGIDFLESDLGLNFIDKNRTYKSDVINSNSRLNKLALELYNDQSKINYLLEQFK